MSSPETNIEKQKGRHRGPLIGIAVLLIFSTLMGFLIFWEGTDGDRDEPLAPADAVAPATTE